MFRFAKKAAVIVNGPKQMFKANGILNDSE